MKIQVKLSAKELFAFSMYNSYTGYTGVINVVFTAGSLALLIGFWGGLDRFQRALLILCAMMFTVIQPAMLYYKSSKQAKQSGMSVPIELTLGDEKIVVEQRGTEGDVSWDQIWRVVELRSLYILRIGPMRAFLVPKSAVAGREKEFTEILRKNLPKSKTKGLRS